MLDNSEQSIKLKWLSKVRWGVLFASFLVFLCSKYAIGLEISPWPYSIFLLVSLLLNLFFEQLIRVSQSAYYSLVKTALILDILLLTSLLYCYGGHTNPFSTLYLVYIILAASLLNSTWIWLIYLLSSVLFAALFVFYVTIPELSMHAHHAGHGFSLHLYGMLLGFILIGAILSFFLSKMGKEVRQANKVSRVLREKQIEEDKLLALASLTAGAAHELSTPLGTIKLIVESLRESEQISPDIENDLVSLEHELQRCEKVLSRMRLRGPDLAGETPSFIDLKTIEFSLSTDFEKQLSQIEFCNFDQQYRLKTLAESLKESLRALVENALDASADNQKVKIVFDKDPNKVVFSIIDQGSGIDPSVKERIGEPFLSTKSDGIGLGLFLVKLFSKRIGGSLQFESLKNGSRFSLNLPIVET
jgi:two-component system sensor histidine kinase RegB